VKLIRGQLRLTRRLSRSVLTLGNFDGFHLGHQQLLEVLRQQAQSHNAPAAVITFEPQPKEFFQPQRAEPRLMRFHEKWRFLAQQNINYLVCLRFNALLAQTSATDFVRNILIGQLGMQAIIAGEDLHFGAHRAGNIQLLQELAQHYGFQVLSLPEFKIDGARISSTRIRQALQAGNLDLAKKLLGRPYFLCGKVVHGDARGREWGFPTANIHLTDKPVSVSGIYVVRVLGLDAQPLPAVASIGVRPMFSNHRVLLEVHLLDFNRDIYGQLITVEFLHKLRDEQIFPSTAKLIDQIRADVENTKKYFATSYKERICK
jgi:riboflavin kinase/FMN adenylyltransferase